MGIIFAPYDVRNALNLITKDPDLAKKFTSLMEEVYEKQRGRHAG